MLSHLYFKEMKQSSKFALFLIFLGIMILCFLSDGSKKIELFGMLIMVFSMQVEQKIFWSEMNGSIDFLLSKPVTKTQILISKYLAMLTWTLPFYLILIYWAKILGPSAYGYAKIFFIGSMFFVHMMMYEGFRATMINVIQQSNVLDFFIRYIFSPAILFSCVGLFIAMNFKYITNSSKIIQTGVKLFPIIAVTYVILVCYSAWSLVNKKARRDIISQLEIFKMIVINETRIHFKHFLLIIGFSFILQVFVVLFDREFASGNVASWMMITSALVAMFFPVMSFVDHIRSGNVYFLLSRPVNKRTVMLAFGASALIYVMTTFLLCMIFSLMFTSTTHSSLNLMYFMSVLTMICFFISFWSGAIYFVIKHRKFKFLEKTSLIIGLIMMIGTFVLMKFPVAAWIVVKRTNFGIIGFGWIFVAVYFLCSLVLVRK